MELKVSKEGHEPAAMSTEVQPSPPPNANQLPATSSRLAVVAACNQYIKEHVEAGLWREDAQSEAANSLEVFQVFIGEQQFVAGVEKRQIAAFLDFVRCLPKKRGRSNALRKLSIPELVDLVKAGELEPIGESTVSKHMQNVVGLFTWAERRGEIASNPAAGVYRAPKRLKRVSDERSAWSPEQRLCPYSAVNYLI